MKGSAMEDGAFSLRRLLEFDLLAKRFFRNVASRRISSSMSFANKKFRTHFPRFTDY